MLDHRDDQSGKTSFGPLDFTVPADRHVITATATDPSGNTSEFSVCSTQDTIFSDGLEGN